MSLGEGTECCRTCGSQLSLDDDGYVCDICDSALRAGVSIEEVRLEVEDLARSFTARFALAEGKPCTCGAPPCCVAIQEGPRRGRGARPAGYIHFDVEHELGCPRAPAAFDWAPVDEAQRRRVFGYDGRAFHVSRLASLLRHELTEREILELA